VGLIMQLLVRYLRAYDLKSASGVDQFVANSAFVSERIARIYDRSSVVIYPPVSVDNFHISANVSDYYLYVGELTHYKQPQLVVDAFNHSGKKLVIVGDGELMPQLVRTAHRNIEITGKQSDDDLRRYYSECKALIFPGVEEIGIVPVEAMASGRPVIAFREGGAVETIIEDRTGCFFDEQSAPALNAVIDEFEAGIELYSPEAIARHAGQFSKDQFQRKMQLLVDDIMQS
ncbi:MAG: glycosyltransferase, partial [Gammaproteobacteria bacterium]